jgi:hypothetical protein
MNKTQIVAVGQGIAIPTPDVTQSPRAVARCAVLAMQSGLVAGLIYRHGWEDGVEDAVLELADSLTKNVRVRNTAQAMAVFAEYVRDDLADAVLGVAVGRIDGRPFVWVVIPDISVPVSSKIYKLHSAVEDAFDTTFDVHVKPAQGRALDTLVPPNFRFLPWIPQRA